MVENNTVIEREKSVIGQVPKKGTPAKKAKDTAKTFKRTKILQSVGSVGSVGSAVVYRFLRQSFRLCKRWVVFLVALRTEQNSRHITVQ